LLQSIQHSLITFIDITSLTAVIGAAVLILLIAETTSGDADYPDCFLPRIQALLLICLSLLSVSTATGLIGRAMEMSGLGLKASLPLVNTVIFKTHYGKMWLVRVAGLISLWLLMLTGRRHAGSPLPALLMFSAAAAIAFARSASGHPADAGDLSRQQLADFIHLLAVASLAGGLLATAAVFRPSPAVENNSRLVCISRAATRFYRLFGPLLAIIVLTGMYNIWFQVGSFEALDTTFYGGLMSAKLLLLVALALRFIVVPERGRDEAGYVRRFLSRTKTEALLVIALIFCVSVMVHQIPAKHKKHIEQLKLAADKEQKETTGPTPEVVLSTRPELITAGTPVAMTVGLKAPDGSVLKGLELSHERILHCVVISRDLAFFAHIHPEDVGPISDSMMKTAAFPLTFTFPKAGEYLMAFDFAAEDEAYSRFVKVNVVNQPAMGKPTIDLKSDLLREKIFGDYRVTLVVSPENVQPGVETTLKYFISKNGKGVTDLEPYLGAAMHLAIVPEDLNSFVHTHGSPPGGSHSHAGHLHTAPPPGKFGPEIDAEAVFQTKGVYKIFSQAQHHGKVLLFDFMLDVQ